MRTTVMNCKTLLRTLFLTLAFGFSGYGTLLAQSYSDNATNYSGSWTNGSNQGTGFGAWSLSAGASSGGYIGNPANDGMGTTGIGTTAFGMYATGSAYFNASRPITNGMGVGDTLRFYWAINFDAGAGNKGFDLKSGSTTIFNVNNTGSATISTTNGNANTSYGTTPMLVTLIRTSSTAYSFAMTSRSGGADYTTTITNSSSIDAINFYIGAQSDGAGQKNMYANAFTLRKFGQYRSRVSGNWGDAATWEFSRDGGSTWATANTTPTAAKDGAITILNGHTVTVAAAATADELTINSGGQITISSGQTLTMNNGTGTDLTVNGTLLNTGTLTASASSAWSVGSGGTFIHNTTTSISATLTAGTFNSGSTVIFRGSSTLATSLSLSNRTFHDLSFESTSGTWSTGSSATGSGSLIVNGNLSVGSNVNLTIVLTGTPGHSFKGNISVGTGGTLNFSPGSAATYNINGTGSQTISSSGTFTTGANATLAVGASSTIDFGSSSVIAGSGTFSTASGSTLITANTSGINGSLSITNRSLNAGTQYIFNGSAAQVTGAALTSAGNLTLNNSAGLTLSSNTTITGALTFTNGKLTTSGKTLTLSSTPSGASTTRYIVADATGTVTMNAVTTSKTITIGTSTSYAPLSITAGTSTDYTAYVTSTLPCTPTNSSKVVNLAWVLGGSATPSSVQFQWNSADQGGSFSASGNCDLGRYASSCPYTLTALGSAAGTNPNSLTANTGFATGTQTYVIGNTDAVYLADPTVATTVAASNITDISASSGGQTLTGLSITAKGLVWDVNTAPTVSLSTKTNDGTGTADFSSSLTSLNAQTLYYARAYATNAAATAYGNEISFRTLSAPVTSQATGLVASASSSSDVDLSWTAASFPSSGASASGYVLLRAVNPNTPSLSSTNGAAPAAGANTTLVSSSIASNATSFTNSGLSSATVYNYLLVPYTWDGTHAATYNYLTSSAPTDSALTGGGASAPSVVTNAATSVTGTTATLNGEVTADGGAAVSVRGFVYSSTDATPTLGEGGVTDQTSGTGVGTFNASISSLSESTTYYVQAYATNSQGTTYGGVSSFSTPRAEPTAQPTSLVFSGITASAFDVAFTAASGSPDGYLVVRSTSSTLSANPVDGTAYSAGNSLGGGTVVGAGTAISGLSSSGLSAGTTYYVFVFAYNNSGSNTDYRISAPLSGSVVLVPAAPAAPSFTSVSNSGFIVNITSVTGADSYQLDVSEASDFSSFVSGYNNLSVSGTTQTVTGLAANTLYHVRVRAVNTNGTSASSTSASQATVHNAPVIGSGSGATLNAITANWSAPAAGGAESFTYTIELSTASNFATVTATQSSISSSITSRTFTGLTEGITYYYRVKAVNAGGSSDWSATSAGYSTLVNGLLISAAGTAVTENFDAQGSSTTLLTGWRMHASTSTPTWSGASTTVTQQASSGAPTAGGTYNWGTSATERAIGAMTSGGFASPNNLIGRFVNKTGASITNITLGYTAERFRVNTAAASVQLFYSTNGSSWTAVTDGDIATSSFPTGSSAYTFATPLEVEKSNILITGLSLAADSSIYIRWNINTTGGSSQGIGIDDVSLKGCGDVSAPTASNQTFCSGDNPTLASLVVTGTAVQWYAAASGGSALATSTALANATTYYATQTIGGCESVNRTAVVTTVNTTPATPTGSATQNFCSNASPVISDLAATGTSIQWYAASNGGSALDPSASLTDNTTYYASQTATGCESSGRLAVLARVYADGTWLGATSSDWNTSSNWCGGVPTSATNVVIPSGTPNSPVINLAATAGSLTINAGASLSFSGTPTLTISGNFTNNGTFTAGSATVTFNGAATLSGTTSFNNLSVSASLNPGTATTIDGALILNSGGSISTNSPLYGASSTLQYNFGGGFGSRRNQGLEWPASNGPANLSITNGSWIQLTGNRSLTGNASITNGALQASGARTLTMNGASQTITVSTSSGGAIYGTDNGFGNDLSLAIASGSTTVFTGDATSSNDDEKKFLGIDVNSGGTLVLARGILCKYGTFTMNGTLQINSGGYVQSSSGNAPTYGSGALLKYNSGGTYGRGLEWSATSGAGYPANVQVSNSTTLNVNNGANVQRQISGNLTVDNGSTFSMEDMSIASPVSVGVTVLGDFTNNGTFNMSTSTERLKCANFTNSATGSTSLSSNGGGDLELTGNLVDNGIFSSNTRAVFFTGTGVQDISGSGTFNIDYLVSIKSSGKIRMLNNLLCEGPNGGNAMDLSGTSDTLDLNGFTLTLGKSGVTSGISGNGRILGGSTSSLIVNGTGSAGTLRMVQSSPGSSNALQSLTLNRTSTGLFTLGSNLAVESLTLSNGTLDIASQGLTLTSNSLSRTSGTIDADAGTITFANASALSLPASVFSGSVNNFTLNGTGGVTLGSEATVTGTLSLTNGNLRLSNNNLVLGTSANVAGSPSSSNMIVTNGSGVVRKNMGAPGAFQFPIGDETGAAEYTPVSVNLASGTLAGGAYLQARVVNAKHPNNNNSTDYLNRYWAVSQSGISSFSAVVSSVYTAADVVGSSSGILMGKWDGSNPWVRYAGSNNAASVTLTSPSISSFSDFTGLSAGSPTVSASAADSTFCNGDSTVLTATASGDGTLTYSWSPGGATASSLTVTPATTTTYTVTVTDANGLTASSSVTLTVNQATTRDTTASACDEFTWYGNTYTSSGSYTRTITNAAGCDSVITLNLTINTFTTSDTTASACGSFVWNGNTYTVSGDYDFGFINVNGCDSIRTLHLTILSASSSTTNVTVCSSQLPYSWNSNSYSAAGTYNVTLTNSVGCDSVATLVLTVNNTSSSTTNVTVCSNQLPYSWNSNSYSAAGTYSVTLTNAANCDSVATLVLAVNNTSSSTTNVTVCSNQLPYSWNSNSYSAAGTYSVTLTNAAGCDSVATLVLTVNNTSSSSTSVSICSGSLPYSWNGNSYSAAGTYSVTLTNAANCDSVATLVLSLQVINVDTTASACGSFFWYGNTYFSSGTYAQSFVNAQGCDSVITLTLTINPFPAAPGAVTGPIEVCTLIGSATPTTYSVSAVSGFSNYLWTVPAGVTLVSGQGATSIGVTFDNTLGSTNQRIRVSLVSAAGCVGPQSFITLTKTAPARPLISGLTNVCAFMGQAVDVTYTCDSSNGAHTYTWTVPAGVTLMSGQGTRTLLVRFLSTFVSGSLTVTAIGNCGSLAPRSYVVSRTLPATPATISGPTSACSSISANTPATYSITAVSGASSYLWTVPAGVTLVSGQGTTSVQVTFGQNFVSSSFKVRSVSNCGNSSDRSLTVTGANYGAPGPITGPTNSCPFINNNDAQATYRIRKVLNAPGYLWTVPQGMIITSHPAGLGANDTVITVRFDSTFVSGTSLLVQTTGCGTSAARSLQIGGILLGQAGAISGPTNVCQFMVSPTRPTGDSATYTIRKMGATQYNWTVPANASIIAHPGGTGVNDTIILVKFEQNFVSGFISVSASNACGTGASRSLLISRLNPATPSNIDVSLSSNCPNRVYTYSVSAIPSQASAVVWTIPSGGTILSGQNTASISVAYSSGTISGAVTAQAINNCSSSSIKTVTVKLTACPSSFAPTGSSPNARGDVNAVDEAQIQIYPNPSTSEFNLRVPSGLTPGSVVRILDMQGRLVKSYRTADNGPIRFGNDLKPGSYQLEVNAPSGRKISRRIVKF